MKDRTKGTALAVAAGAYILAVGILAGRALPAHAQGASAGSTPKLAEQAFKNIQVLKGIPADQVFPTMQFISASLGVQCEYCHVEHAFEKDDKEEKQTARKMIQMMFAINKDNFGGRREVTCYSCHHGAHEPAGIPAIAEENAKPEMADSHTPGDKPPALPSADQLLEKYVQAVGGAEAVQKISSRVEKGQITAFGGRQFPIEVYSKAPDKRVSIMHMPNGGESVTAFDGHAGWLTGMGPPREMTGGELEAARLDADFYFPVRVKQVFNQFRPRPPEKVADHEAYVLAAIRPGQPPVKLYFDEQSGLLLRMLRYTETPLGRLPSEIDYSDYRDVDGVKLPFRWSLGRPFGRFTIQVEQVQQNVPIDDAKFVKPAGAPPKQ